MIQLLGRSGGGNQADQLQATTDGAQHGFHVATESQPATAQHSWRPCRGGFTLLPPIWLSGIHQRAVCQQYCRAIVEYVPVPAGLNFFDIGYGTQMAGGSEGQGNTLWLAQYSLYGYREAQVSSAPIQGASNFTGLATVASISVAPNPADRTATLQFQLRHGASVELALFTSSGQQVWGNKPSQFAAGDHTVLLDFSAMPQGAYYLNITANGERMTYPVAVVRR